MQTIERKPSTLKSIQLDQCNKLQQKYQQDIDLLEELRLFMRQRAVIEKVYAQSLCKLVQQSLLKRQFPTKNSSDSTEDASQSDKLLLEVWKNVLDETRNAAMVRTAAAEAYLMKISEQSKQVRSNRSQIAKMVFDELNGLQKDISISLQELNKSQKVYREEERVANDARVKAENASNKVRNRSTGLFTSLTKLQQQSLKLNARVEMCEVKSTAARNEYILNLKAANAHMNRYYTTDLPDLIQILDGEYFDAWRHFLTIFTTTELQCCSASSQCFSRLASDINKISQKYEMESFLKENAVMTDMIQYPFCPQDNDPISNISRDHQAELDLDREARKWATKVARENRTIRQSTKTLGAMKDEKNKAISSSNNFLVSVEVAVTEAKLEEERKKLRQAEVGKAKAEARIEALRDGGVEVDVWLNSANADLSTEEEETKENTGEIKTSSAEGSMKGSEPRNRDSNPSTYATVGGLSVNMIDSKNLIYPVWCVAVYDYKSANTDELTIQENENLQILGEGDGDGWMRAKNDRGEEGLVPENYIRIWSPIADMNNIDVNEENVDDGTLVPYAINKLNLNLNDSSDGSVLLSPYAVNNPMMNFHHPAHSTQNPTYSEIPNTILLEGRQWARALFDYEATCDEELSFQEGQFIRIISTEHDGVDDGWWQGEIHGVIGLFPSLVVEELTEASDHLESQHESVTPANLPTILCNNVTSSVQNANTHVDGAIILSSSSSSHTVVQSGDTLRLSSLNVQSLFDDGTESAV